MNVGTYHLEHVLCDRLRYEHGLDHQAGLLAEVRRGKHVMAADGAHGHEPRGAARERLGQQKLELADLVAAIHIVRLVVALDPQVAARP